MPAAQQIYSRPFDRAFFSLPPPVRERIEAQIDRMGTDLAAFDHKRLAGSTWCRLRVGDYRVIYRFDIQNNELELLYVGHRREIYRGL